MDLIIVPFHDYKKWINEGFRTRDAHLYEHFEKSQDINNILIINRPVSLAEFIIKKRKWKTKNAKVEYSKRCVRLCRIKQKVWCLDLFVFDFARVIFERKKWWYSIFKNPRIINDINEAIDYINLNHTVLLLQNPMSIGLINKLKYEKFVFDAIDNWLYHPQMKNKELIKNNYEKIDINADLITIVSEALADLFKNNSNVRCIPNGVDIDYFKKAFKRTKSNKLCIGYVGKIQERIDFTLIESCLKEFKDCIFEFVGPILSKKKQIKRLQSLYKNIHFMGDIHYSLLPEIMESFDIAIIPHIVDSFTSSMNPLKLYEYLSAGKPVVTTLVAGTTDISPFVFQAREKDEFIRILGEKIQEYSKCRIDPQIIADSIPQECTWKYRLSCLMDEIKKIEV